MRSPVKSSIFVVLVIFIAAVTSGVSYSQKKSRGKLPKGAVTLEYNFPENLPISYLSSTRVIQTMEIDGQTMQANVIADFGCTVKATGKQEGNLKLEIRVDTMYRNVDTPQGSSGGAVKEVQGKVFTMILSPLGSEVDLTEAEKITFSFKGSSETSLAQSFVNYFPKLPKKSIKPGDTWITNDTIESKSPETIIKSIIKAVKKFEGIEQVDGVECAKITAILTGTRVQKAQSMGMDILTEGSFSGTEKLYFATKAGFFIKQVDSTRMNGNMTIQGEQEMSFPLVQDLVSTNAIRK